MSQSLRDWMDKNNIGILEAAKSFGVSVFAVKKWLNGDRIPRSKTQATIKKITKGAVTGDSWVPKD